MFEKNQNTHFANRDAVSNMTVGQSAKFVEAVTGHPRYGLSVYPNSLKVAQRMSEIDGRPVAVNLLLSAGPTSEKAGYSDFLEWQSSVIREIVGA